MRVVSLQSGSNGNCIFVEAAGVSLLFDAGISGHQAQARLEQAGWNICSVDALIISHDHRDHCSAAGVYQRKYGLPIHATRNTFAAMCDQHSQGRLDDLVHFEHGDRFEIGPVSIQSIRTPHDAVEGSAFIVEAEGHRLGVLTDLGCVFDELRVLLPTLDAVLLEANYDEHMLASGSYPAFLKDRIRGVGGHLSNREAAHLLAEQGTSLTWACLGHLSEDNNTPALALRTVTKTLAQAGRKLPVHVASRYQASPVLEI